MNQNKKQILKAIEYIKTETHEFCCCALGQPGEPIREEFDRLFNPNDFGGRWVFFSNLDGSNISPMPPRKEQIEIRLTALWFFYHMQ